MRIAIFWSIMAACSGTDDGSSNPSGDDSAVTDNTGSDTPTTGCSGAGDLEIGNHFLDVDGQSAWLLVPAELPECAPLLVFAHGGGSPGGYSEMGWIDPLGTHLVESANGRGYALLVPFLKDAETVSHTWSFDEIDTLDAMIAAAQASVDIDRDRVLFAGQSAGGHIAAYYGLHQPAALGQVAVVSAGLGSYFDYPADEPDPKLPFFVAHDPADETVPYAYSEALAAALEEHGHDYVFQDHDLGEGGHRWVPALSGEMLDWWLGRKEPPK